MKILKSIRLFQTYDDAFHLPLVRPDKDQIQTCDQVSSQWKQTRPLPNGLLDSD